MITQREFIMIHELRKQGHSIRSIARITGKDRKTITRHLRNSELAEIKRNNRRPSKLEPFKSYILERISKSTARIPAEVIYKEIISFGFAGSLRILQTFLSQEYGKRIKPDPVVRFETAPGYQVQVDWTTIRSGKKPIYAFVMTMGYSRASFVYFSTDMSSSTLLECHHKAFSYFGGVPKTILFDNMRTVIDKRDAYGEGKHKFNDAFYQFSKELGFTIKLCKPYRARTKGKVERFNHYLKGNFYRPLIARLSGGIIEITTELLNSHISGWLNEANNRIHGTTNKKPLDLLKDEIPVLLEYVKPVVPLVIDNSIQRLNPALLPEVAIIPIQQPQLSNYDRLVV